MKWFVFALLFLALGVGAALWAVDDPGYVLIARERWSLEMAFSAFLVLLTLAFLAVYLCMRVLVFILHTPRSVRVKRETYRLRRARREQTTGILRLIEGTPEEARRLLLAHVADSDSKVINYLGASLATQRMGELEQRDGFLHQALKEAPEAGLAIGLMQAELQGGAKQREQASATLGRLVEQAPRNPRVLELTMKAYRAVGDWKGMAAMVRSVRRAHALPEDDIRAMEVESYTEMLRGAAASDFSDLSFIWDKVIPRRLRKEPELVEAYGRALLGAREMDRCESNVRSALKHSWQPGLVELYGRIEGNDPAAQLRHVEDWLKQHPKDPVLLLAAGRLAIRNRIWGRARSYLESAINHGAPLEAYLELGRLLEDLDESDAATGFYRRGLENLLGDADRPALQDHATGTPRLTDPAQAPDQGAGSTADSKES
ncbi:MAG: hypothetical protein LJE84_07430 [Gammaproteobacteria bacterium]|jgi:HemY protein|nr:hypothetical protein [Gammaproteobacteria bacterium]